MNPSLMSITECLPPNIAAEFKLLPLNILEKVNEIRLRSNRAVALTAANATLFLRKGGKVAEFVASDCPEICQEQLEQTVYQLCRRSIYCHQDELCQGFISLPFGNRAGVCGKGVLREGRVESLKEINSINIRIARQIKGCSNAIKSADIMGGIIIAGPPGSGKTTLLRDIARRMASGEGGSYIRTAVADERGELAAVYNGTCGMDVGFCDVISGIEKSKAAAMAIRSMNPQLVVFDELGSGDDVGSVKLAAASGVAVATSIHISPERPLEKNPYYAELRDLFPTTVVLSEKAGEIKAILKNGEMKKCG